MRTRKHPCPTAKSVRLHHSPIIFRLENGNLLHHLFKGLATPNKVRHERNQLSCGRVRRKAAHVCQTIGALGTICRAPVSAPLLGGPPISAATHVVSGGQSPKAVPPPPPPPPHAPKTAQLTQPREALPPPAQKQQQTNRRAASDAAAASERMDDYRAVRK